VLLGPYGSRPAPSSTPPLSRIYITSDGPVHFADDSGEQWRPMVNGTLGYEVPDRGTWPESFGPDDAWTDNKGTMYLSRVPFTENDALSGMVEPRVDLAGHFRVTAAFRCQIVQPTAGTESDVGGVGLVLRNSVSGRCVSFTSFSALSLTSAPLVTRHAVVDHWTDPTTFSAEAGGPQAVWNIAADVTWLQIEGGTGNRVYRYSLDGLNWTEAFSEPDGTFTDPDRVGFCVFYGDPNTLCGINAQFLSYHFEALS
jgi:hypothetical protein